MPGPPDGDGSRGSGLDPSGRVLPLASRLRLLVVLGPTGTGKSELAFRLAQSLGAEIVGCDALQVYRGLDTATAKPPTSWRELVPHHLVDCADPRVDFSMARYVWRAERAIAEISSRDRVPIVAGGTGLYLRGLLRGVVPAPPRDERLRARIRRMAGRYGPVALHRGLRRLDPESAKRLPAADIQRVVRAIEFAVRGDDLWSERLRRRGTWPAEKERFVTLKIGLMLDRGTLNRRLDERVDRFFESGLVDEVRALLDSGVPPEANAFKGIGYREVLDAIQLGVDAGSTRERVKIRTRRFAKRQITWFKKEPGVHWLNVDDGIEGLLSSSLSIWHETSPGHCTEPED